MLGQKILLKTCLHLLTRKSMYLIKFLAYTYWEEEYENIPVFSVVQSTSAIACYIVNFKCMRWSKRCSVSESLFFTGNGLPEGRYRMSYNCSFTLLYYLYVSRKGTNIFHKYTILSHFLSLSFLIFSIPFLSFLAV